MEKSAHLDDPAHWRRRADEAQRMANCIDDPAAKQSMMDIAAAYEQLAALLETKQPPRPLEPA